ncbi:MAG: AI-2E family transporter [Aquificaceae bacterium]
MGKERIFSYFLLGLTIFFTLLMLIVLIPFLKPILWAIIFSLVFYPPHMKLSRIMRSNSLSALFITLIVLVLIVIPFFFLGIVTVHQSMEITRSLIYYFQNHTIADILHDVYSLPFVDRFLSQDTLQRIQEYIQSQDFKNNVASYIGKLTQKLGEVFTSMVFATGSVIFKSFVFLISFFFILRDGKSFIGFIERFVPMYQEDLHEILLTVYRTILAVVYGSIGVATVQSLLAFLAYTIIGIEYSLLWSLLTFMASFVPPFGTGFVWFPIAVYTFIDKGLYYGIFMFAWGLLVISTIDNIVRPLIMKMGIRIPYIVLFFATVGGLLTFGFVGIFIGPIIFTILFSLAVIYERRILKQP